MSFDGVVKQEFEKLSTPQQKAIVELIFLFNNQNNSREQKKKNNVPFNKFAGGLHYISDDFDETPEGFEDYM